MTAPPEFTFLANHPALDFCNTVGEWVDGGAERDQLASHRDLVAWGRQAGLLSPGESEVIRPPRNEARLLARTRAFRGAVYELVSAALAGRRPGPGQVALVGREVARAHSARRPEPVRGSYAWRWTDPAAADRPLLAVALAAADLLAGPLARVHRCSGDRCGWLFLDTSRAGRRRWCSMSTCGNTAKVRRFRRRNR